MIDGLLTKQRTFLNTLKPQRTNLYTVEFPPVIEDQRQRIPVSYSTNIAAAALSRNRDIDTVVNSAAANPASLFSIKPDLGMMCERTILPGVQIETIVSNKLTYNEELAKSEGPKQATFTLLTNQDMGEYITFMDWKNLVIDNRTKKPGFWSDYAEGRDIIITTYSSYLEPKVEIVLKDCFPKMVGDLTFSYMDENEILKFDITMSVRDVDIRSVETGRSFTQGILNRIIF